MSFGKRRKDLINEVISLATVERSFLRKLTIPTLSSILEEIKNKQ